MHKRYPCTFWKNWPCFAWYFILSMWNRSPLISLVKLMCNNQIHLCRLLFTYPDGSCILHVRGRPSRVSMVEVDSGFTTLIAKQEYLAVTFIIYLTKSIYYHYAGHLSGKWFRMSCLRFAINTGLLCAYDLYCLLATLQSECAHIH